MACEMSWDSGKRRLDRTRPHARVFSDREYLLDFIRNKVFRRFLQGFWAGILISDKVYCAELQMSPRTLRSIAILARHSLRSSAPKTTAAAIIHHRVAIRGSRIAWVSLIEGSKGHYW